MTLIEMLQLLRSGLPAALKFTREVGEDGSAISRMIFSGSAAHERTKRLKHWQKLFQSLLMLRRHQGPIIRFLEDYSNGGALAGELGMVKADLEQVAFHSGSIASLIETELSNELPYEFASIIKLHEQLRGREQIVAAISQLPEKPDDELKGLIADLACEYRRLSDATIETANDLSARVRALEDK